MLGFGNSSAIHDLYASGEPWDVGLGDPSALLVYGDGEDVLWGHGDPPPFGWVLVWAWDTSCAKVGGRILTLNGDWPHRGPFTVQLVGVPSGAIFPQDAPGLRQPPTVRASQVVGRTDPYAVEVQRRPYQRTGGNPIVPPSFIQVVLDPVPVGLYDVQITYQGQSQTVARLRVLPDTLHPSAYRQRAALSPALSAGPRIEGAVPRTPPR